MKNMALLISSLILAISFFYALSIRAEAQAEKEAEKNRFIGTIKDVDCKRGEIKLSDRKGEESLFYLTDKTEFRNIKGCEDIKKDGMASIQYSVLEGRKVIRGIRYREMRGAESAGNKGVPSDRKIDIFMGWVGSVDCGKGLLSLQKIDDRNKADSFLIEKDTNLSSYKNGCSDITTNSIVMVRYIERDGKKIATMVKPMIASERR